MKKILNKIRNHLEDVIKLKTSSRSIAAGFAIGTFFAVLPTFGLGAILGLLTILIFPKISKISLLASFIVWNPVILLLLSPLEYKLGDFLYNTYPILQTRLEFLNIFAGNSLLSGFIENSRRFLIGNFIFAPILSIFSYFGIKYLVESHRAKFTQPLPQFLPPTTENINTIQTQQI